MTRLMAATIVGILAACSSVGQVGRQTPEDNKAVVRGYMEEIANGKQWAEGWDRYFADRVVFNEMELTKDLAVRMWQSMHDAFPDLQLTIEDQIAEADRVATRVTFRGTHRGVFQGIPATGRKIEYSGIAIDRIVDGRVVEMWHQADHARLLEQLAETGSEG